jgi:hypothetical protein
MLERSSFYLTGALREGEANKRACIPPAERGLSLAKLEVLTSFTQSVQSSSSMELYPSKVHVRKTERTCMDQSTGVRASLGDPEKTKLQKRICRPLQNAYTGWNTSEQNRYSKCTLKTRSPHATTFFFFHHLRPSSNFTISSKHNSRRRFHPPLCPPAVTSARAAIPRARAAARSLPRPPRLEFN